MDAEEAREWQEYWDRLPRNMVKNANKIFDHEDAVLKVDPDHWEVISLRTPSRRVPVYRRGDLIRCRSDKKNNQDQPCAHILVVMVYEGLVERPNTAALVFKKNTKHRRGVPNDRNHALEQRAWREVPSMVPALVARLLREGLPVIEPPAPIRPGPGRPPAPLHALVYQAVMRVWQRQNQRMAQGAMNSPEHRQHNPYGALGASTVGTWLSRPEATEVLEKLLALSTWPARPYETLVHPDGTGMTENRFSAYYDERYRGRKKGEKSKRDQNELNDRDRSSEDPRKHKWTYTEILWTYRYTLIASMYSQQGPFGEAPWLIPLLERAQIMLNPTELGGDKAYVAYYIFDYAKRHGIDPQIKFKKNTNPTKSNLQKKAFKRTYEQSLNDPDGYATRANRRNNAETGNHAFKMLLGDQVYSKTAIGQRNELLCMAIAYNMTRLIYLGLDKGVEIQFAGGADALASAEWAPLDVLHRRQSTL